MRVLLVDEAESDGELAEALEIGLSAADIATAQNPGALDWSLDQRPTDVVILNADLAWCDPETTLVAIQERWPATPLFVISDRQDEEYLARLRQAGARLSTPFTPVGCARLTRAITEAVATLEESRYRQLFALMPAALYLSSDAGRLLDANPAFVELLGYPDLETLLQADLLDLYVNTVDRDYWKEQVIDHGTVRGFETRLRRHDGTEIWVRENSCRVTGESAGSQVFYGNLEDISAQKSAEKAVRESESWYRTLFEAAHDAIFLMDGETIIDCNPRTLELFAANVEQIIGRSPADLSPLNQTDGRSSGELATFAITAALRGQVQHFEWIHRRLNGEVFDAEISLSRLDIGERSFLQGIIRDITDRKRAERSLKRREAILEAVSFAAAKFLQAPNWQDLADEVLAHFGKAAGASRVNLAEVKQDSAGLLRAHLRYFWVARDVPLTQREELPIPAHWIEAGIIGEPKQGHVKDLDERDRAPLEERGVISLAVVPIFVGGEVWGFLGIDECRVERPWSEGELEALRAAAQILGAAIFLGQAREAVRIRTEELELLNRINSLLASTVDAIQVMQEISDIIRTRFRVDHVSIALIEENTRWLNFAAWSGYDSPHRDSGIDIDGAGLIAKVAREGDALYVADISACADYLAGDERVHAEFLTPILLDNKVIGVINCESFSIDGISVWQRDVVKKFASQAAIAIRNSHIYKRLDQ